MAVPGHSRVFIDGHEPHLSPLLLLSVTSGSPSPGARGLCSHKRSEGGFRPANSVPARIAASRTVVYARFCPHDAVVLLVSRPEWGGPFPLRPPNLTTNQ